MTDTFNTTPPGLVIEGNFPRDHATVLRESLRETAREHHTRHIPRHFETFAAAKYGYKQRNPSYRAFKKRLGLGDLPLVFSGRSKASVLGSREITATQKRATLKMRMALEGWDAAGRRVTISASGRFRRQIGQTTLSSSQQQILARIIELKSITGDEQKYLADFLATRYGERAKAPGTRHRTRRRRGSGA